MAKQQTLVEDPDKITEDALNIIPDSNIGFIDQVDETVNLFNNYNLIFENQNDILNPLTPSKTDLLQEEDVQFDLSEEEYNSKDNLGDLLQDDGLVYPDIKYDNEVKKAEPLLNNAEIINRRNNLLKIAESQYIKDRGLENASLLTPKDKLNIRENASLTFRQELLAEDIYNKANKTVRYITSEQRADYEKKLNVADKNIKNYFSEVNIKADSIKGNIKEIDSRYDEIKNELNPIYNNLEVLIKKQKEIELNISTSKKQTQDQVDIINEELTTLSDKGSAIADREYLTQGTHDYAVKSLDAINSSINTLASKRQLIIDGFNKLHNDKYVEFEDVLKLTRLDLNKIGLNEDGTVIEKSLTSEINNLKYSRDANIKAFEDVIYNSNKYSFQDEQEIIQLLKALDKEHDISKTAPKDLALSILGLGINTATWVKSLTIDPLMSAVDPMYKYKQMNLEIEIDEFFDNEQAKLRDPIAFRDIETTYDFADWFSHLATTQAPQAAVLFATRGLVGGRIAKGLSATTKAQKIAKVAAIKSANTISRHAGLSFLSASSAGATFREGKKAIRNGAEYSDLQLYMAGTMSFGAEYFSELYTSKMISGETFKVFKTAAFKKGFVGWAKNKFKTNNMIGTTLNLTGEGASEGFAEILGNNFVDRYIYGNKDVSLWSNVDEAFVSGIFMAGAIYKMPMIAKDAINGFVPTQNLEVYALNKKEIDQLSFNISNNELTTKEIEIHEKRIAKLVVENNNLISDAIIVIDEMSNEDKRSLLDVELELNDAQNELEEISNLDKIDIVSLDIQSKIKTKIKDLKEKKNEIAIKYYKQLGNNKAKIIKNQAKKIYGEEVIVRSSDSLEDFQRQIELDLREEYTSGLEEGTEAYDKAMIKARSESEKRSAGKDALITEVEQGSNKGKEIIYINNSPELVSINVNAAAHEFLHKLLQATLKSNPSAARKISVNLKSYIDKIDKSLINDESFSKRLESYSNFYKDKIDNVKIEKEILEKLESAVYAPVIKEKIIEAKNKIASLNSDLAEETMTLFSDALANKNIKYEENSFTKVTDSVRRTFQDLGYKKIKFNTGEDVFNFIRDYNDAIKSGNLGSAFIKVGKEGVEGKLIDTKRKTTKKTSSIKYSKSFKDNVKRKFNNVSEKDELPTRDAWPVDGDARKGKLALSIAGLYEGTLVSSLRPGQSQILQQSGRVEEFKEDAKTNLAMHILNFDSNKNDNVHGWINSQVANKAQDAIKGLGIELETFPLGETEKQIPEQQSETTAQERQEEEQASQNKTLKQNISVTAKSETIKELRDIVNVVLNDLNIGAREVDSTNKVSDFVAILKERIQGKKPGTAFKLLRKAFKVGNSTMPQYRDNLLKNKEAILKGLTTSYLSRAFPPAIEKRIITEDGGTKFVKSEEWLKIPKKNIGKKPGFIDIRSTKEEGYEGDTTGKQAMRRVENISETISDEVFLAKYIVNNKVPQMPSEMLMQQLVGEIGLDIFQEEINKFDEFNDALEKAVLKGESVEEIINSDRFKIISSFVDNQKLLKNVIIESTISNLTKQLERGTTKYSMFSDSDIVKLNLFFNQTADIINQKDKSQRKIDFYNLLNDQDEFIKDFYKQVVGEGAMIKDKRAFGTVVEIENNLKFKIAVQESEVDINVNNEVSSSNSVKGDIFFNVDGNKDDVKIIESKSSFFDEFSGATAGIKSDGNLGINAPKYLKQGSWVVEAISELQRIKKIAKLRSNGKKYLKREDLPNSLYGDFDKIIEQKEFEYFKENNKIADIINNILIKVNPAINDFIKEYNNAAAKILTPAQYKNHEKKSLKGEQFIYDIVEKDKNVKKALREISRLGVFKPEGNTELFNAVEQLYVNAGVDTIVVNEILYALKDNIENLQRISIGKNGNHVSPGLNFQLYLKRAGGGPSVTKINGNNNKVYELRSYSISTIFKIPSKDIKILKEKEKSNINNIQSREVAQKLYDHYSVKNSLTQDVPMDPSFVDANFANKKAIIVVGGIGSGKTTIINKIIDKLNLKELGFNIVDEDIERSKIQQDKNVSEASAYQNARKSVKKRLNDLSNNGDGIIYDNVGGNRDLTTKKVDELKSKGYDVSMILVDTNVEIAKKRDAARDRSMGDFMVELSNGLVERRKDLYAKDFEGSFSTINTDNLNIKDPLPSNFVEQVKSNIKYSITYEELSNKFNNIIQETKGVDADDTFSETMASLKGADIGNYKFFVPPSADDFMGLMYAFMGKGKIGEGHKDFIEASLNGPYKRGVAALESAKQKMENDYKQLKKKYSKVVKKLGKKIPDSEFTYDQAIRVYLWKYNNEIFNSKLEEELGLSTSEINKLFFTVTESKELQQYARGLGKLTGLPEGYIEPSRTWLLETIASDLNDIADKVSRKKYLAEFVANKETIFSKENLNKIQAIYGTKFRSALEDSLYAMTNGTSRNFGDNKIANQFADWLNGSVGAIMFINARSAALQLISNVNYLNWSDNNLLQASTAFANQKQFWTDFTTIIMSDKLKQRRKGLSTDVQAAELANSVATSKSKYKSALRYLLRIGFTPTQAADAIAISFGGAAFYRNRINSKIKNGQSKEVAEKEAWREFSDITDATQQSADAAMVSQQQRNPLTRFVLAFQNTAMQYNRVMKKSFLDLVNRRGNDKENISKIIYYGAVQNIIFNGVQQAMFAMIWGDDESDEKEKQRFFNLGNGMIDTILRGSGWKGAVVAALKNTIIRYQKEEAKGSFKADHLNTAIALLNVAPSIGSKFNKVYGAYKTNYYERDVIKEKGYSWDSPIWMVYGKLASATLNIPADRVVSKVDNLVMASKSYTDTWQKVALSAGWSSWSLGLKNKENEVIKAKGKEQRKILGIEKSKATRRKNSAGKRRAKERRDAFNN
mgnify:FL=1